MRASSPRKALVWPKCLFTPAITTSVSSWRSGAAPGDGVLAAMSAVAGAGIACGGPGRVAHFDGHPHALTLPPVDLVALSHPSQPVDPDPKSAMKGQSVLGRIDLLWCLVNKKINQNIHTSS